MGDAMDVTRTAADTPDCSIVVKDALCSSIDKTHDAILDVFHHRYAIQIEPISRVQTH